MESWIHVTPSTGVNSSAVTISADSNWDRERKTSLICKAGNTEKILTIKQEGIYMNTKVKTIGYASCYSTNQGKNVPIHMSNRIIELEDDAQMPVGSISLPDAKSNEHFDDVILDAGPIEYVDGPTIFGGIHIKCTGLTDFIWTIERIEVTTGGVTTQMELAEDYSYEFMGTPAEGEFWIHFKDYATINLEEDSVVTIHEHISIP